MARESSEVRARVVAGAADLLRRRGFTAASVREIAKHSGAPLGSTYHYFPGGKSELATEAVRFADGLTRSALASRIEDDPRAGLAAFIETWRTILEDSDFGAGCPVLAVAVDEHPDAGAPRAAAAEAFAAWRELLAESLRGHRVPEARSRSLAALAVAAVEGAVAMCRAERSTAPLDEVATALDVALAGALEVDGG
ncbi:TetR/AcrR family transcriptional regulator [Tsukamurella sp. M9C]|uniref:TetR/AcrR family transcriptional regulator n=1 Tax=unclassified Tsukamurella TaxID=2633480 RepID=UPI001CCF7B6F|nr:TetR/AcrR family transcriptional regulator [Tsukamurella sp. M9C]MCA0155964.1 TetR/AcrR family transcriptional regulator [Tsukamurella sp. M9C]